MVKATSSTTIMNPRRVCRSSTTCHLPMTQPKKKCKVSTNLDLSPHSKMVKRVQDRSLQLLAFKDLMTVRAASGGETVHGDIQMIVDKYQSKGHNVERWHLEHQISLDKVGKQ
jgi:hypothetical protein